MEIIQQLLNGLTVGGIYALIALGYTMVYGIIKLINFAHGDIFMIGAFAGFFAITLITDLFIGSLVASSVGAVFAEYKLIIAIVSSFDIALVVTLINLTDIFVLEILIGVISVFLIILLSYHLVFIFYKKKGMIRND